MTGSIRHKGDGRETNKNSVEGTDGAVSRRKSKRSKRERLRLKGGKEKLGQSEGTWERRDSGLCLPCSVEFPGPVGTGWAASRRTWKF